MSRKRAILFQHNIDPYFSIVIYERNTGDIGIGRIVANRLNRYTTIPIFPDWISLRNFLRAALEYVEGVIDAKGYGTNNESGLYFRIPKGRQEADRHDGERDVEGEWADTSDDIVRDWKTPEERVQRFLERYHTLR